MRRFVKWTTVVAVGLCLTILGVSKIIHSAWNHERIASSISRWISNPLAGKGGPAHQAFTFGRIDYDWLPATRSLFFGPPLRFDAYDIGIWDAEGNEVLYSPHAQAALRLDQLVWSLLWGMLPTHKDDLELHFSDAVIDTVRCSIKPMSTGAVNIVVAFSKRVSKPPTGGGMVISADRATIRDGSFSLGFPGWLGELPHLTAQLDRLRYSSFPSEQLPDRPSFTYSVSRITAPAGTLTLGSYVFPLDAVETSAFGAQEPERQHLIMKAVAHSLGATVIVDGKLTDTYSDHAGVDLRLGLQHGKNLLALLPTKEMLLGDPDGSAWIHGPFSKVVIEGDVAGAEFRLLDLTARKVAARYRLEGGKLALSDVRSDIAGGHVTGGVVVDFGAAAWKADLRSQGVDPSLLGPIVPIEARSLLAGHVDGAARASGSFLRHPERVHIGGVDATLTRRNRDELPKRIVLRGELFTSTDHLRFEHFSATGDGLTAGVHGSIDTRHRTIDSDVSLEGKRLDPLMQRLHLPAALGGVHVLAHATGPLVEPLVDGTLVATEVGSGDKRLPRIDAHLRLSHGNLSATSVHGEGFGGEVTGSVLLGLFDGPFTHRLPDPRLSMDLDADRIRVHTLLDLPDLKGELSGQFSVGGTLKKPLGHVSLKIPTISIYGDPYRDGTFEADIVKPEPTQPAPIAADAQHGDGIKSPAGSGTAKIAIAKVALTRVGGGQFSGSGDVGLDGSLDVNVHPTDFPLVAIPALRDVPVLLAGLLSGNVHLGGALGHWIPQGKIDARDVRIRGIEFGNGTITMTPEPVQVPYSPTAAPFTLHGNFFEAFGFSVDGRLWLSPHIAGDVNIRFKDINLNKILPELKKVAEVDGTATGTAHIAFDLGRNTVGAELRLSRLVLAFSSDEEDTLDEGEAGPAASLPVAAGGTQVATTGPIAAVQPNASPVSSVPADRHRAADEFRNEDDVIINWDGKTIAFNQVHLRSRIGELEIKGTLSPTDSDATVVGQLELRLLEYFAQRWFAHTHGQAFANVHIRGPMSRPRILGTLDLRDAGVAPRNADRLFKIPEGRVIFDEGVVQLRKLRLRLDELESRADGFLELKDWVPGKVSLKLAGEVSPMLLAWIFPDYVGEPAGRLGIDLQVSGSFPRPSWDATVVVHDVYFHEKSLSRDVRLDRGTVQLHDLSVVVGCADASQAPGSCAKLTARIDDNSELRLEGTVVLGGALLTPHLETIDMHIDGENLEWGQPGVFTISVSPHVELTGGQHQLRLSGLLNLVSGRYYQNFEVDVLSLLAAPRTVESDPPFYKNIPLLESLELALTASSSGSLFIKDNLADLNVTVPGVDISGTLGAPSFGGTINLEQGGRFRIPFLRADFISDQGTIVFEKDKKFPEQTPSLSVSASTDWLDRYEQSHHILLTVSGTYKVPNIGLSSTDGWDRGKVLIALATGSTPDDLRRATAGATTTSSGTPTSPSSGSSNASDNIIKETIGSVFSRSIEDPLKAALKFDLIKFELGYDTVFLKLCPINQPSYKLCGSGDVGIVGSTSRYEGRAELKLTEDVSLVGSAERIQSTVDTAENDLNRLRLQLSFKRPVF